MGEIKKSETSRGSWFKGLQAEFRKIKWPDRQSLVRQTIAVIIVSVVVGAIIAVLDMGIQYGIDFLVSL
ncbi:MAG: preprotein translocase subunit SecE [Lachnospiraceae bacterium]|nr:preprotein translocase subunit SecE [Lachnospiraceae bacterium]